MFSDDDRRARRSMSWAVSNAKRVAKVRAVVRAARSKPCVDCGLQLPPECMELDHVRGEKLFRLNVTSAKSHSQAKIEAEIAKCDVRCPNCHRLRHFRLGDYRERSAGGTPAVYATAETFAALRTAQREAMRAQVIALRAAGLSHRQVAEQLGISPTFSCDLARGR